MSKNCEHTWKRVDRSTEGMDISYHYYQCVNPKCSKVNYPMDQFQKLLNYSESNQFMFLEDWIFALFYALPDSNIVGWTSIQKQVFLLMMEFAQNEHIPTENIGFYAYDYGPYDDRIADAVEVMVAGGLIDRNGRNSPYKSKFCLTSAGKERAEESFNKLTDDQKQKLVELRMRYQMLGTKGLLKYVYTYYDEYTHESKIRDKVLGLTKKRK